MITTLPIKAIKFLIKEKRLPSYMEILSFFNIKSEDVPLPKYIQLEPTTKCNFKCIMCTRKKLSPSRLNRHLSIEDFRKIIQQVPSVRKIKLQGMGEPLLNPELHEILEYGKSKNISFTTTTNGSLLHTSIDLVPYFDEIVISVDTAEENKFKKIRIGGNFKKIISNIEKIVREKKENNWKTKIGINSVISHLNFNDIPRLVNLASSLGVDFISIVEVENWKTPIERDYTEERKFIEKARKKSKNIKKLVEISRTKYPNIKIYFLSSEKRKLKCRWPFTAAFITVDGFVTPCCIRMDPEVINFGNVFEQHFKKIWNSEKYKVFRRSMIKNFINPICDECPD